MMRIMKTINRMLRAVISGCRQKEGNEAMQTRRVSPVNRVDPLAPYRRENVV